MAKLVKRSTTSSKKAIKARKYSYPALLLTQNRHKFYITTIPVEDFFPYCFVSRREKNAIDGFQRTLTESRAEDIAKYLAKGSGSIPTNIVVSAQDQAELKYNSKSKVISFDRLPNSFLVLDGQHRLWGYHYCVEKFGVAHRVPVAIYDGLSRAEEVRLFIDINTNQKGVPAALLLDIQHLAEIEKEREKILRELFDKLARDSKSPLVGKMSPDKSKAGKVSRVSFNRAFGSLLESSVFTDLNEKDQYTLLLNYLNAYEAELLDDNKSLLTRSAFIEAIGELFDETVRTVLGQCRNLKQNSIQQTVRPAAAYDYRRNITGRPTKVSFLKIMRNLLRQSIKVDSSQL